jgi:signal transduction histidine kinase
MIVNDYQTSPYAHPIVRQRGRITAVLAEPLLYGDRLVGVIRIDDQGTGRSFAQEDQNILRLFAVQAAIAIENARLHGAAIRRGQELGALLRATRSVMAGLNLQETLDRIIHEASQMSRTPHVKVLLVDREAQVIRMGAVAGRPAELLKDFRLPMGVGHSGIVAATAKPLYVADCPNDPRNPYADQDRELGLITYLGLPIMIRGEVRGVLTFNTREPRQYGPEEIAYLASFADMAAVAIENARLHETAVKRAQQLATLTELTRVLTTVLDPQQVAREILAAAQVLIPGAVGRLWECSDRDAPPRLVAAVGLRDATGGHTPNLHSGEGVAGLAASTREPVIIPDVPSDPRFLNQSWAAAENLVSCLILPLLHGDRVTGILAIYTRLPHQFADEEVSLLLAFAGQAAIAIENARLYQESRRHAVTLEERVRDRTRELEAARRDAETASRHKSEFLANMSHELRTPLNSIIGFADVLQGQAAGPLTEKQARFLGHIQQSGRHLFDLISDILDLSKVEAGKLRLQPRILSVAITLEDVLVPSRDVAAKKSQHIHSEIEAELPPLRADPVRFKQICFNLLSNAIKFTPEGGTITLRARRVPGIEDCRSQTADCDDRNPSPQSASLDPHFEIPGDFLEIAVTDTGIGIKPEDLSRLFQDFVQLEHVETKRYEGTGLGLALTKRLVELHGGRIRAESAGEGRGSTFTVVLPFSLGGGKK